MSLSFENPDVGIRIKVSPGGTHIHFQFARAKSGSDIEVLSPMTRKDWEAERASWQEHLGSFRDSLEPDGSSLLDPPMGGRSLKALRQLRKAGGNVFSRIMGTTSPECKLQEARKMMGQALRRERGFDYGTEGFVDSRSHCKNVHPPLVVIHCRDEDLFPWETLPWLLPSARDSDLIEAARCFLGFCAITFRNNGEVPPVDSGLYDPEQGLPVTCYPGAGLRSQTRELRFLDQLSHVKARPWTLRCRLNPKNGLRCWSALAFAALRQKGFIHHFAGHGNPDPAGPHSIELMPGRHKTKGAPSHALYSHTLHLDALAQRIARVARRRRGQSAEATRSPSLVFLNLCSSSVLRGSYRNHARSLPTLVRLMGHSACIVTEARVGDDFASAFAKRFYVAFLHGNEEGRALSAGEALLWAKWHFLRLYHNPQGLLYSLRGRPEIRVRQPVRYVFPK